MVLSTIFWTGLPSLRLLRLPARIFWHHDDAVVVRQAIPGNGHGEAGRRILRGLEYELLASGDQNKD